MTGTSLCLIPGCGTVDYETERLVPYEAVDGMLICSYHYDDLTVALDEIPELFSYLPLVLQPGTGARDASGIGTAPIEAPAPIRLDVVALADPRTTIRGRGEGLRDVLGTLLTYSDEVRELRGMDGPKETRRFIVSPMGRVYITTHLHVTVQSEAGVLKTNLAWLCRQEWIEDVYDDLRAIHKQLQHATGMSDPDSVGDCYIRRGDAICPGKVIPTAPGYRCTRCKARWTTPKQIAVLTIELGLQ